MRGPLIPHDPATADRQEATASDADRMGSAVVAVDRLAARVATAKDLRARILQPPRGVREVGRAAGPREPTDAFVGRMTRRP